MEYELVCAVCVMSMKQCCQIHISTTRMDNHTLHCTVLGVHVQSNSIQYNCSAMKSTFMMSRVFSVSLFYVLAFKS